MSYGRCPSCGGDKPNLLLWCGDNPFGVVGDIKAGCPPRDELGDLLPPPDPEGFCSLLPVLVLKPV